MNILGNKWFSLFCTGINAFFAVQSLATGNWLAYGICSVFAAFCFNNFLKAG